MTFFFETYGCQMNKAESASVEQLLIKRGWSAAHKAETADLIIINTCSVRATAESRIEGRLGWYTALRKALERFYPCVNTMRLIDYKVRVLDSKSAAAAKVRVLIESASGSEVWTTVGVSSDIVEASWLALVDSFEYILTRDAAALELQKNKI